MIRKLLVSISFLSLSLLALDYSYSPAHAFTSGSPGGYTGSPSDGVNCRNCHSGGAAVERTGLISSNIPATGYLPGTTYDISATITQANINKFGFELEVEDEFGQNSGTIIISDAVNTKSAQSGRSITHRTTAGTNNSKTWNFRWTAPTSGTGKVTFYAAFNATNGNGGDNGDQVFVSSTEVNEQSVGIADFIWSNAINLYPNPVQDVITISLDQAEKVKLSIVDLSGKIIQESEKEGLLIQYNVSDLPQGVYQLLINKSERTAIKRFVKL